MSWDAIYNAGYADGYQDGAPAWRYAIGQQVHFQDLIWTIVSRRWVERQILPPYGEYQVYESTVGLEQWEVEADLTAGEEAQHSDPTS